MNGNGGCHMGSAISQMQKRPNCSEPSPQAKPLLRYDDIPAALGLAAHVAGGLWVGKNVCFEGMQTWVLMAGGSGRRVTWFTPGSLHWLSALLSGCEMKCEYLEWSEHAEAE